MCHRIFMYKRRDKNTNFHVVQIAQTKCLIKYTSALARIIYLLVSVWQYKFI